MKEACRESIFELFTSPQVIPVSEQVSRLCSHPAVSQKMSGQAGGRTWDFHDIVELLFREITNYCVV